MFLHVSTLFLLYINLLLFSALTHVYSLAQESTFNLNISFLQYQFRTVLNDVTSKFQGVLPFLRGSTEFHLKNVVPSFGSNTLFIFMEHRYTALLMNFSIVKLPATPHSSTHIFSVSILKVL